MSLQGPSVTGHVDTPRESDIDQVNAFQMSDCEPKEADSDATASEHLLNEREVKRNPARDGLRRKIMSTVGLRPGRLRRGTADDDPLSRSEVPPLGKWVPGQRALWRGVLYAMGGCLLLLAVWYLCHAVGNFFSTAWPGDMYGEITVPYPADFLREVQPIPCHSHNDYWRRVPLYDALAAGCTGVEADVWLIDDELYVGHSKSALIEAKTLSSLYIDPLVKMLNRQNPATTANPDVERRQGVFDLAPETSVILLIDLKTPGAETWPHVVAQLEPLRRAGWLTAFNGTAVVPSHVTVVGTGNSPYDILTSNTTYRDYFFDAPLADMYEPLSTSTDHPEETTPPSAQTPSTSTSSFLLPPRNNAGQGKTGTTPLSSYTSTNSYYASIAFGASIGRLWLSTFTDAQLALLRGQIRGAHRRGLKVRYWDLPDWPVWLRKKVWRVLVKEGVDVLNVDDLEGVQEVLR